RAERGERPDRAAGERGERPERAERGADRAPERDRLDRGDRPERSGRGRDRSGREDSPRGRGPDAAVSAGTAAPAGAGEALDHRDQASAQVDAPVGAPGAEAGERAGRGPRRRNERSSDRVNARMGDGEESAGNAASGIDQPAADSGVSESDERIDEATLPGAEQANGAG